MREAVLAGACLALLAFCLAFWVAAFWLLEAIAGQIADLLRLPLLPFIGCS
jgi:hypothetical protein